MPNELKTSAEISLAAIEAAQVSKAESTSAILRSQRARELHEQGLFASVEAALQHLNARAALARGETIAVELREFFEEVEEVLVAWEKVQGKQQQAFAKQHALQLRKTELAGARNRLDAEQRKLPLLQQWIEKQRENYLSIAGDVSAATGISLAVGYGEGIAAAEAQMKLIREHSLPHLEKIVEKATAALKELDDANQRGAKA